MALFYGSFFMALLFLSAPSGRVRVLLFSSSFAPPPFYLYIFNRMEFLPYGNRLP